MNDAALFVLLVVAIGVGWWLGRRAMSGNVGGDDTMALPSQYYRGLNYLLDDQPDVAIDAFIAALDVNSETFETHVALGNLLRRKGEVDRAIRIHQNLLARDDMPSRHLHQAHLELARDYVSAGLLDRAERLLQDLVQESPQLRVTCLRYLQEIYQDEREWAKAIEVTEALLPDTILAGSEPPVEREVLLALSHYRCELAQLAMNAADLGAARTHLKHALEVDEDCVRASLLLAELEQRTGHPRLAIKALKRVRFQDPEFIPETVAPIHSCYRALDDNDGLLDYLRDCMEYYPSVTLMLRIAEDIRAAEGDHAAGAFIARELKARPSLQGLAALVRLHVANANGTARDNLLLLQQLINQLIADRPSYRCNHCGFSGRRLHWLCPGCKAWGSVRAIRGTEGD